MKVEVTRTKEKSMNLIAGTEGLTFEKALSVLADKVVADREAAKSAKSKKADKPAK